MKDKSIYIQDNDEFMKVYHKLNELCFNSHLNYVTLLGLLQLVQQDIIDNIPKE